MVALAPNTSETSTWDVLNTFPKLHSRTREVKTRICTEAPASKSFGRVEIWLTIYESCDGLESFTRDPIGLRGGANCLYEYCHNKPHIYLDPMGKQIMPFPHTPTSNWPTPIKNPPRPSDDIPAMCGAVRAVGCGGCGANCESDLQRLFDDAKNNQVLPQRDACNHFVYDFRTPKSPCFKLEGQGWEYPLTWNPLIGHAGHMAVKVTLCDGTVFYVDNGWWGRNHYNTPNVFPVTPNGTFPIAPHMR